MSSRRSAFQYAKGLFSVALDSADPARVAAELGAFAGLVDAQPDLGRALTSGAIPALRKAAIVGELLQLSPVLPIVSHFLILLARHDHLALLPAVLEDYDARLMRHQKIEAAEITTAIPLPAPTQSEIAQSLSKASGQEIRVSTRVDPSIVGGVVARVGSTVYDGSIRRQLERVREQLAEGP